jgi:alkylation response protein AidB-like acyl-CoA dehydrogenase
MITDLVPFDVSAVTGTPVPVITSGAEAIRTVQEFAAGIADGVIERDRSGALPVHELAAFDVSGLLAMTVPRKHGGAVCSARSWQVGGSPACWPSAVVSTLKT